MVGLERCPLILTWMCLFFRKFFMKASMFSFIPSATRVFMILFLCIVSYAFSMSRHTLMRCSLFRNASRMLVSMFINISVVDRYCLKPYWLGVSILLDSRCHLSRLLMIFSRILHRQLIKVIGL